MLPRLCVYRNINKLVFNSMFSLFLLLTSYNVFAAQCSAVFSNGVQNNSNSNNSNINFGFGSKITNSPVGNILDSKNPLSDNSGGVSCDTGACSISGSIAATASYNSFPNNQPNVNLGYQEFRAISPGNYNNISLGSEATLMIDPGDYAVRGTLSIGFDAEITVSGPGVVRFFVRSTIQASASSEINASGDSEKFLLYSRNDINFVAGSTINAFVYSKEDVTLNNGTLVNGAISGKKVTLGSASTVNFNSTEPNFDDFCDGGGPAIPIANYRLDECSYTGVPFDVIDQTATYPATSFGSLNTDIDGQIERFANLADEGHHIETSIAVPTNFSVSTWFKKPTSTSGSRYFVLGAMENGGDLLYVDRGGNRNWKWSVYDGSGTSNGDFSFASLDENWHHLTLVYSAGKTELYIDGALEDSVARAPAGTLKYIGTSYDGVNGNDPQGFRAPLDEFLVYDKSLTASDISTLYNNQLAKKNFDGSVRDPVNCSPFLAFYQFEQTDFSSQIDDTSGSDNHADNLLGGLSTADGKYCRGFESESWNDYNDITDAFRSGVDLNNDVGLQGTVSFWFNSTIDWDRGSERVLFDASEGSSATDKYFVFEIQQDGRLKFAFEDSSDSDFNLVESSVINRVADTWYYLTVTWDYIANDFAIYVDGTLQIQQTRNTNGAMGELEKIVFGDNSSDYTQAGNSPIASPYSSRGHYDEVRIYKKVLTQIEIQTDMNEDFGCISSLVAEWRMDEAVWSGTSNDVLDEVGNLPGRAFNNAYTDRTSPARVGNPGTCGYGEFDGIDDYIQINDDPSLSLSTGLTISTWIYPRSLPSGGTLKSIVSKDTNYEFHLNSQGEVFWWWGGGSFTTNGANISENNWYHVAITYRSGEQSIYVNGVEYGDATYQDDLPLNGNPLQIGQDQGISSRFFHGRIDEVKIYDGALNEAEVFALFEETHPCDVYIDHFEIDTLDQTGITCQADEIIIKACADASCSTVNPDAVDVELSINNTLYKTVTVAGTNGTTTSYPFTTVGTALLSVDQTYDCTNTLGTTPCAVDFKDSGFVFSDIPMQISGKPSDTGFNTATLSLKAVETNTDTGVCQGTFPDNTDVDVDLSYSCNTGLCTNALTLTNNNNQSSLNTVLSPYTLRFSNDSTAFFSINYPDAGKLTLNAQKDVEVEDNDGNKVIKDFSGSSESFVERPFAFKLDFSNDINNTNAFSNDASGTAFKKAGEPFTMTATAVQWAANQDNSPYDGKPDDFSVITTNLTALYFDNEKLTVNHKLPLQLPVGGADGILIPETSNTFGVNFPTSQVNNDYTFSEVGIITLNANLESGNYLSAGTPSAPLQGNIEGLVTNVGRFYPDHFVLEIDTHGELSAYCDNEIVSVEMPFVYTGQMSSATPSTGGAIRYSLNPSFTITAMSVKPNSGAANITENYTQDFMKLEESGIIRKTIVQNGNTLYWPVEDGSENGSQGTRLKLTSDLKDVTTSDLIESGGVITYTYNNFDNFIYTHELNAEVNLFTTDINLPINSIIDPDGVTALDADDIFDPTNAFNTVLTLQPLGVEVRFGRAYLENSYGPETSPLPQVLSVEYFNDEKYVLAENDICSLYNTNKVRFGAINEVGLNIVDISPKDGKFDDILDPVDGLTRQIILPPPGSGNQGRVEVLYDIYDWLKYDWAYDNEGVDGLYNDDPRAIATFGIFRGNDRIIYQREIQR